MSAEVNKGLCALIYLIESCSQLSIYRMAFRQYEYGIGRYSCDKLITINSR
ncbi:hypothetical protein [Vibrio sp. 99-8-1]|uniref:hypothetical protein n=1 Tax=Vibrio sp. 99-8-1 TaxID=2607602 RepID=UPI0014932F44|nr:hypothetical protein [Vibrio sp. 99-8-1]